MVEESSNRQNIYQLIWHGFKYYQNGPKKKSVFEDLSIEIKKGTRLAIMGPNGCGKTTLVNILIGLDELSHGIKSFELGSLNLLGVILQDYRRQLLPWASVEENILLPFSAKHESDKTVLDIISTAREFLAEVGYEIPLFKKVKFLSGGEQQAIILARAIAFHPGFFIWDEPFSAIDFRKRETLYRILTRYWDANSSSIVLITHSIEEVIALAHRLIVFDEKMSLLLDQEVSLSQSNNATFPQISKVWTDLPHE